MLICHFISSLSVTQFLSVDNYSTFELSIIIICNRVWYQLALQWCCKEIDGVSNRQPHDCSLSCLFRHRSKKTSKFRVTGLCAENSPVTGEFPALMANNAGTWKVSHWWRHHGSGVDNRYNHQVFVDGLYYIYRPQTFTITSVKLFNRPMSAIFFQRNRLSRRFWRAPLVL